MPNRDMPTRRHVSEVVASRGDRTHLTGSLENPVRFERPNCGYNVFDCNDFHERPRPLLRKPEG